MLFFPQRGAGVVLLLCAEEEGMCTGEHAVRQRIFSSLLV